MTTTCAKLAGTLCLHYNKHNPPQEVCLSCEFKEEISSCGGVYEDKNGWCKRDDHPKYTATFRRKQCDDCPWKEPDFSFPELKTM